LKTIVSKLKPKRSPDALASEPPDILNSSRCDFTFSDGRQCRSQRAQFCVHHAPIPSGSASRENNVIGGPLSSLEPLCADLTTATNINRALAQTFLLMAQGRISRKDAVAFGYLSQLLLQTVPGIRSEFVSAFGYRKWETRLRHSLDPNSDEDPEPSSGGNNQSEPTDPDDSYEDEEETDESSVPAPVMEPDYGSLYLRSLALFDRKYDTTPEGRHEADKLVLELELLNPNPGKPPRGHFGRVVDLVRRLQEAEERESEASQLPPIPAVPKSLKAAKAPPTSFPHLASSEPSSEPAHAIPSDPQVSPPAYPPFDDRPSPPFSHDFFQAPKPSAPEPGASLDWYAPPSWSGNRTPDPFPSRKEKLKRKFGGMSNSKLRRLQHQNSRSF
jgi:hypothetical protein